MMTLQDVKRVIDTLSIAERVELREYLEEQTPPAPDRDVMNRIQAMFAAAPPPIIHEGSMDVDALFEGLRAMTDGLTEEEVDELIDAMNQRLPSRNVDIG
jgi:hypothetical protein